MSVHYTYVLLSQEDNRLYTDCTHNQEKRVPEHRSGRVSSTAHRVPLELIYFDGCRNRDDAFRHERFLETGKGKRFWKNRHHSLSRKVGTSWNGTRLGAWETMSPRFGSHFMQRQFVTPKCRSCLLVEVQTR